MPEIDRKTFIYDMENSWWEARDAFAGFYLNNGLCIWTAILQPFSIFETALLSGSYYKSKLIQSLFINAFLIQIHLF
jgi:fumarate reductase subunit C